MNESEYQQSKILAVIPFVTIISGITGFTFLLGGVYSIVFSLDALLRNQFIVMPIPSFWIGTRSLLGIGFILIILGIANLKTGFLFYEKDHRAPSYVLMLFGFQTFLTLPSIIGPIIYLIPMISIIGSEKLKSQFSQK